jgi:hypothetical protein
MSSGGVVNLTVIGNPSNSGNPDRPNVLRPFKLGSGERSIDRWFDTSAFAPNAPFTYGNAARTLYKEFRVTESMRFQFRWEAFNAFNTPQFDAHNVQVGNANFGRISSAARPRNQQFGLKFVF